MQILLCKKRLRFLSARRIRRVAIKRPVGGFLEEKCRHNAEDGRDHEIVSRHIDIFRYLHQPCGECRREPGNDDRDIKRDSQRAVADAGREKGREGGCHYPDQAVKCDRQDEQAEENLNNLPAGDEMKCRQ
ncbi:hypothetical protein D3C80_1510710 [compost metagenome]